ncbi:hypothetical protein ECANGB1_760 [Enterospora canceri]|uniref:Uncharacterized protein n=1 Tax=Enterospora canceri TaxID=1081671 RepID=A0A1Y1S482_9MICR|nr:hypothetical protein ECANGB1_760 [Enterospora canceri]
MKYYVFINLRGKSKDIIAINRNVIYIFKIFGTNRYMNISIIISDYITQVSFTSIKYKQIVITLKSEYKIYKPIRV